MARLIGDQLDGSYLRASRRSDELNPRRYGAKRATSLEGFLFPATYTLKRGRPVELLVDQQLTAFRRNFSRSEHALARSRHLTAYDVLTIASMIDREASVARERRLIASVIYNRLRGHPAGDRRDDPLRDLELDAAAHAVAAADFFPTTRARAGCRRAP